MPRRIKSKPQSNGTIDDLPPHSPEAEQGVLGCILLSPQDCIVACVERLRSDSFYDLRHQSIFNALSELHRRHQAIDVITLQELLKKKRQLVECGGLPYLSSLPDAVPSAANISAYLDTLAEKWQLRKYIRVCHEVIDRAQNWQGDIDEFLWATRSDLLTVSTEPQSSEEVSGIRELNSFDFSNDPNAVIGLNDKTTTRFMCRGYGAWLIGPSGVGKSSLVHQWACHLALGRPLWGIAGVRPLRVLIIQAENDKGDAAEMTQGIIKSLGLEFDSEAFELLCQNVVMITERRTVGEKFCDWLGRKIVEHRAEVVFVDPFLSFAGVDVTRNHECSKFLRTYLNPVLNDTGAALIAAHHTGKPKFDRNVREPTALDYAYAGLGGAELVNWARAVMVLRPIDEQFFELKLAKRGWRAGAVHPDGSSTLSIYLRHSADRIFWEQAEKPAESAPKESKPRREKKTKIEQICDLNIHDVLSKIPADGESAKSLGQRFQRFAAKQKIVIGATTCRTTLLWTIEDLKNMLKHDDKTDKWFKGPNA